MIQNENSKLALLDFFLSNYGGKTHYNLPPVQLQLCDFSAL